MKYGVIEMENMLIRGDFWLTVKMNYNALLTRGDDKQARLHYTMAQPRRLPRTVSIWNFHRAWNYFYLLFSFDEAWRRGCLLVWQSANEPKLVIVCTQTMIAAQFCLLRMSVSLLVTSFLSELGWQLWLLSVVTGPTRAGHDLASTFLFSIGYGVVVTDIEVTEMIW